MSLVLCIVPGCPHYVREGLKRENFDPKKRLADGRTCWRCRAGQTAHLKKDRLDLRTAIGRFS